jgi:hypothetical protein
MTYWCIGFVLWWFCCEFCEAYSRRMMLYFPHFLWMMLIDCTDSFYISLFDWNPKITRNSKSSFMPLQFTFPYIHTYLTSWQVRRISLINGLLTQFITNSSKHIYTYILCVSLFEYLPALSHLSPLPIHSSYWMSLNRERMRETKTKKELT